MKKFQKLMKVIAITILTTTPIYYFGQSTSGNNNTAAGKYLGYNGAQDLEFRTNNTTYMQLMQNGNSTINGFNIDRSGFWVEPGFNHPSLNQVI